MPMRGPTTDHAEIRQWAQSRNAAPIEVSPYVFDSQPAILKFMFGEVPKDQPELRLITWETFFAQFDLLGLALVYEEGSPGKAHIQYELLQIESKSPYRFQDKPI